MIIIGYLSRSRDELCNSIYCRVKVNIKFNVIGGAAVPSAIYLEAKHYIITCCTYNIIGIHLMLENKGSENSTPLNSKGFFKFKRYLLASIRAVTYSCNNIILICWQWLYFVFPQQSFRTSHLRMIENVVQKLVYNCKIGLPYHIG